jgi:nitrate/TMAO reductase-like tetraheme cytochrome c subunit
MSDIIFNCYPKIRNEEVQIDITEKKQREIMAAYCLIILSLFDSLLDKFQESKQDIAKMFIEFISLSYNDLEKRFISDNLEEWIYTLKKMKKNISKKCKI